MTFVERVADFAPGPEVAIQGRMAADLRHADGIVVLTGGERRLAAGLALLEAGVGRRLLVSGVNRETSREMIRRTHKPGRVDLFACCTDLGYEAGDTAGNASEARTWTQRQQFHSLIVVTANYHMPRSLTELGHAMPGVRLIPHPVDPRPAGGRPWWANAGMIHVVGREYIKYMRCASRMHVEHLRERASAWMATAAPIPSAPILSEPSDGAAKPTPEQRSEVGPI